MESETLPLPGISWHEDTFAKVGEKETKLRRWGSVQHACKILDECTRETLYELIETGEVYAYKLRPKRPNSHWKVDLMSVWYHKQSQIKRG